MTKDEIMQMEAGREIDLLVAEKIFSSVPCANWALANYYPEEWIKISGSCEHKSCHPLGFVPSYSSNIAAAWEVVVKMENNDYWWTAEDVNPNSDPVAYSCTFSKKGKWYTAEWDFSMPLAICKSALLAVLGEKK